MTISPFEWSFPFPQWMENLRASTGNGPTNLSGLETLHIVHVLEQVVRGYLCGSNTKTWGNHVFQYRGIKNEDNVLTYFYRFEFQQRGTVHLHMLVWLKNANVIKKNAIKADIPWVKLELAERVVDLQKSDKSSLNMSDNPNLVTTVNGHEYFNFCHPTEASALNLHAYISTLIPSLKCRMDVQSANANGMLLKYAASYVTKWHDAFDDDALFSVHVGPYEAAYRHLRGLRPLEPEMWLSLSSKKVSWSKSRTKKIAVPVPGSVQTESHKYCKCAKEHESLSFKEWLREFDDKPKKPKRYKDNNTLVGMQMRSAFSDVYFYRLDHA